MIVLTVELIIAGIIANILPLYYRYKLKRAVKRNARTGNDGDSVNNVSLLQQKRIYENLLHDIELQLMKKELSENQIF